MSTARPSRSTVGLDLHDGKELLDRVGRPSFLPETEEAAHHDDAKDDAGIDPVAQEERDPGRDDEDEDYRALELAQKQAQSIGSLARAKRIGAVDGEPFGGLGALKSFGGGVDLGEKIGRRSVPERRRCHTAPEIVR